ncbi:hypothetical protein H310_05030 [Aphanomyces invadans]|uniref:Uncharacterized protein n=1 Tax=Aphanomyces invadans TaxID=157072 RepID=A0A024UBQ2_9STRA|nr:hypothetical protein H310_05030 [Aphanomyces invadans]ETW03630.1 hypothetical protein H310_05030 [Aphanomyces invadans]|eukprot:XP_008867859.1 hypothetical protein H310_05030 [Aphanomyces invadans]
MVANDGSFRAPLGRLLRGPFGGVVAATVLILLRRSFLVVAGECCTTPTFECDFRGFNSRWVDGGVTNASTTFINPSTTIGHCRYTLLEPSSISAFKYTKNIRARTFMSVSGEPQMRTSPHRFGGNSSSSTCSSKLVH